MQHWLNLFTGTTWKEFRDSGAEVTGFREKQWKRSEPIQPGDILLCYLVGVKRWVGRLEVTGQRYRDETPIWDEEVFPVRFPVQPHVMLSPEQGVPMETLEGQLSFLPSGANGRQWSGHVRSSPTRYSAEDGETISVALRAAQAAPIVRPVDEKQLSRSSNLYRSGRKMAEGGNDVIVSVPDVEDDNVNDSVEPDGLSDQPTHTEIQFRLLEIGSRLGCKVWAPANDRNRKWDGKPISEIPSLLNDLPTNFDDASNRIIKNIDVIWLSEQNAILAAFEVEHTSSMYSGLLRMSDLLTMQPNIDIRLFVVAPDERLGLFKRQVPRPTFAYLTKPLPQVCKFIPYSDLCSFLEKFGDVANHLRPEFLDDIAVSFNPATEFDG